MCVLSCYLSPGVEICHLLNVGVLSCYLRHVVKNDICYMFVCVVLISQPSSRDLLSVKCLYVLSCYLSPVVENGICKCLCVVLLSQRSSRDLSSVKCLCVLFCYLRHVVKNDIFYMFVCVVLLSQPSSREWYLLCVNCLCVWCLVVSAQE